MGIMAIQDLCSGLGGLSVPQSHLLLGIHHGSHVPLPGSTDLPQPAQRGSDPSSAETSESTLEKCSRLGQGTSFRFELICSNG